MKMKIIQQLFDLQGLELGPKANSPATRREAEALRVQLPETVLGHYDRLVSRGKKAVALVRHGVCTGCMMRLASGLHAALLRNDDICVCDNCARYLMLAHDEVPGAALAPPPPAKKPTRRKRSSAPLEAIAA